MSAKRRELETVKSLFRQLLLDSWEIKQDMKYQTMLVLADALEDMGADDLADAYRWASHNRKWPDKRTQSPKYGAVYSTPTIKVYDWNSERTEESLYLVNTPKTSRLPKFLHRLICQSDDKKYGGIHRAFVLLAKALIEYKRLAPEGAITAL